MINELVKVYWNDAVAYQKNRGQNLSLVKQITEGELFLKNKDFIIIKNPKTTGDKESLGRRLLSLTKKKITFLYIPKGMVKKIEKISQ